MDGVYLQKEAMEQTLGIRLLQDRPPYVSQLHMLSNSNCSNWWLYRAIVHRLAVEVRGCLKRMTSTDQPFGFVRLRNQHKVHSDSRTLVSFRI